MRDFSIKSIRENEIMQKQADDAVIEKMKDIEYTRYLNNQTEILKSGGALTTL